MKNFNLIRTFCFKNDKKELKFYDTNKLNVKRTLLFFDKIGLLKGSFNIKTFKRTNKALKIKLNSSKSSLSFENHLKYHQVPSLKSQYVFEKTSQHKHFAIINS